MVPFKNNIALIITFCYFNKFIEFIMYLIYIVLFYKDKELHDTLGHVWYTVMIITWK